jgi:UDP-N-acetylmuramate--alanine ligase
MCLDHPHVQDILPRVSRRHVTYGVSAQADYSAKAIRYSGLLTSFVGFKRGEPLGEFVVNMPGTHNVLNCLAVIAVADELEVPLDVTKQALATFGGVGRRFSVIAEPAGLVLVDDYGHHPAEIEATLDAAQRAYNRRVVVAFQPHRYTRTRDLFDGFSRAFNKADVVIVTDIYPAGEAPIPGVSAANLAQSIREHGHHDVTYVADKRAVPDELMRRVETGDIVIALGAGDINASVRELAARLEAKEGAR